MENYSLSKALLATKTPTRTEQCFVVEWKLGAHSCRAFWDAHARLVYTQLAVREVAHINPSPRFTIPNDGIIRYLGLFNRERLLVTSPKALSEVLTTNSYDFIKPSNVRQTIGKIMGIGVLLAEADEHKLQRKNLMPAFAFRHVKNLYPLFWEKSREAVLAMMEEIEPKSQIISVDGQTPEAIKGPTIIEAQQWASRATLDIIGEAGMGQPFGSIKDPNTPLSQTYSSIFKPSPQARLVGMLNLFLPGWLVSKLPVRRVKQVNKAAQFIRSTTRQLIREKQQKLEKHQLKDLDILSIAMASGGFSEENLVDQMMTFLAAGHETTSSALCWAIYLLCVHPEMQSRLRAVVRESLPSLFETSAAITSQDIDQIHYLNAVCNEVLRYFPPVPITSRDAARDTTICGQFVPKGTHIMLCPLAVNRGALWGADARSFNPDRWMSKDGHSQNATGGTTSNYAMMTFLHGPRSCIGQGFAKAEFACLLAAWVGRFEFELRDEEMLDESKLDIRGGITARLASGLWVKVKVVDGW